MGSFFSRSSSQSRTNKKRLKTRKHDPLDQNEASIIPFIYPNENSTEFTTTNGDDYEKWNQNIEQQSQMGINNDPPGAPITFRSQYESRQNNAINQPWTTTPNQNNPYYETTSAPHPSTLNSDRSNVQNGFFNSTSQGTTEERPSKKVQFNLSAHRFASQSQALPKTPLTGTHSWHEPSVTAKENVVDSITTTTMRTNPLVNSYSSSHQSSSSIPSDYHSSISNNSFKPIYVSIDHQAMITERGLPAFTKRTQKPTERNSTEAMNGPTESHRQRSQTHASHRSGEHFESNNHRAVVQSRNPNSQRPVTTTASGGIPNRPSPLLSQSNLSEQSSRATRMRSTRPQSSNIERSAVVPQMPSSSSSKTQPTRQLVSRTDSPSRTESNTTTRRVEHRSAGSPMMRIPISQHQHQHQHHHHHHHHNQSGRHHHTSSTQRNNSPQRVDNRVHQRSSVDTHSTASPVMKIPISQQTQRQKTMDTPSSRTNATRARV